MILVEIEELESKLAEEVARRFDIYVPVEEGKAVVFRRLEPGGRGWLAGCLARKKSVLPPTKLLTPQTDPIFRFEGNPAAYEVNDASRVPDMVILGAKPCDARALKMIDRVFTDEGDSDPVYLARRQRAVLIGVACGEPEPTCFCESMGIGPGYSGDCDLMIYSGVGLKGLAVESITAKGQEFLAGISVASTKLPATTAEELKTHYRSLPEPLSDLLGRPGALSLDSFDLPLWEKVSERCLSCGLCTYLCPTCYCFAIADKTLGEKGLRARCWDSCMFPNFLKMAGGHNPRPTKKERVRQRFMHKLCYAPEKYGELFCVGCGRCVEKCPVGLHIADVLLQLKRVSKGVTEDEHRG